MLTSNMSALPAQPQDGPRGSQGLVREQRPEFYRQSRRCCWPLRRPAREGHVLCVDEKPSIQAFERAQDI